MSDFHGHLQNHSFSNRFDKEFEGFLIKMAIYSINENVRGVNVHTVAALPGEGCWYR
jgi:hypothetical protein